MVKDLAPLLCTSKFYKKNKPAKECGVELLILISEDGETVAYICPECDALELMPKNMRERIKEQWEM